MSFFQGTARILLHRKLARDTWQMRVEAPALAAAIRPGQFFMVRVPPGTDPLLGRPFALYDIYRDDRQNAIGVDFVYLVVGKMTGLLARMEEGQEVEIWGPLGNGFPEPVATQHVGLVAGGIGQTPFLAHVRELLGLEGYGGQPARRRVEKVSLYYGVRSAEYAAGVEDFRKHGAEVHLASNDGSIGKAGFVTQLVEVGPMPEHLFGCGPEPMLHALAKLAVRRQVLCHLSLETPMACGVGICFSCVTPVKAPGGWDYKRVCVDGPIFDASCLHWK